MASGTNDYLKGRFKLWQPWHQRYFWTKINSLGSDLKTTNIQEQHFGFLSFTERRLYVQHTITILLDTMLLKSPTLSLHHPTSGQMLMFMFWNILKLVSGASKESSPNKRKHHLLRYQFQTNLTSEFMLTFLVQCYAHFVHHRCIHQICCGH